MTPPPAAGIRERNRVALTEEILATARTHLAEEGAAGLSLRAVAREVGMSSSAVYRYFPSRDDLLTRLIIEGYDSLGAFAERAERRVPRADHAGRFRAIGRAVRTWALAHEHEYALLYGTPVPGYRAPQDTIGPATRVTSLLVALLGEVTADDPAPRHAALPPKLTREIAPAQQAFDAAGVPIPPERVVRALISWAAIFGAVSFELFGHFHNVLATDRTRTSPFFEAELDRLLEFLGVPSGPADARLSGRDAAS